MDTSATGNFAYYLNTATTRQGVILTTQKRLLFPTKSRKP